MNLEAIKQYRPIIKQALLSNSILILYYAMPNLTSFLLSSILIISTFVPNLIKQISTCDEMNECCSANSLLQTYLKQSFIRKLMTIVFIGFGAQLSYLLPNWLIAFIIAQAIGLHQLLINFGAVELISAFVSNTEQALIKFSSLIPKYQD